MALGRRGVYPGSFDPPTVAHVAIAEAALTQRSLDSVDLVVSRVALGKESVSTPLLEHRLEVIAAVCERVPWLALVISDAQLIADISEGYDVVIMGADKWAQIHDPVFYADDVERMRSAVASLPEIAVAPRPPHPLPPEVGLDVHDSVHEMSSTRARGGRIDWMCDAAASFDRATGAWSDPDRYWSWLGRHTAQDHHGAAADEEGERGDRE